MPIPDPLRSPDYESGGLVQSCSQCDWAQRGHQREVEVCPECGAAPGHQLAIVFGGVAVIRYGKGFQLVDKSGNSVSVNAADCAEVAQFFCRHSDDTRTGKSIQSLERPSRIEKRPINEMLWPRSGGWR